MIQSSTLSLKVPPSLPGIPFLGNARAFLTEDGISVDFLQKAYREHGNVVHFTAMNRSFYLVSDPELIRQIMLEQVTGFVKLEEISREPKGLARFLGRGILTAGYEEWKPQRKLIQPLMQHKHIAEYANTMSEMCDKLLSRWQDDEQRDIQRDMTQVTMWIIAQTMFGISVEQNKLLEETVKSAQEIVTADIASPLPSWLTNRDHRAVKINAVLNDVFDQLITDRRVNGSSDRHDLLSVLMQTRDEDGQPMSDEFLRDNILTMFFAGHETTANTLTWAFYYLSQHPDILAELQREVDSALSSDRLPTTDDLSRLPYTMMVIKETMRIQPIVAMVPRAIATDTTLGGYQLKAGSFILISPYVLHHDPRRWSAPEKFDPTRFSAENEPKIEKYAYLPFGGGPRICIGNHFSLMEAQILLSMIVSRYNLRLAPDAKVQPLRHITTSTKHGLPMLVEQRI